MDFWNLLGESEVGGFTTGRILAALTVSGLTYFALTFCRRFAQGRIDDEEEEYAEEKLREGILTVIAQTQYFFIVFISLVMMLMILGVSDGVAASTLRSLTVVVVLVQIGIWANSLVDFALRVIAPPIVGSQDGSRFTGQSLFQYLGSIIIWALILMLMLDNLGVDITTLVASLGVGGIAVALALQAILGDLLSSISILMDRPFERGDFIVVGDTMGSVEKIGMRSTVLQSLGGEKVIIPNSDLVSSRIHNYKRMSRRRIVFHVGVLYNTDPVLLKAVPGLLQDAVEAAEGVTFDRAHFCEFGDSALIFETVYYVESADYNVFMDCQQKIYFEVAERFKARGVEFAYPTQTLHIQANDPAN